MDLDGTRLDIAKRLKEYLEANRNQSGTAVGASFIKDGELIAAFTCGTQDGNPEKPTTVNDLFSIGSVAKVYCALAVMKLVEMKKINLDTSITEYLPYFTMKDERYKQITLRMCLNHSSGLPGTNLKYCGSTEWLNESLYDDFYDYFAKSKLKDTPGNTSVYCNDGYMLAEMVVAKVSGTSFIQFVQEHITIPAGALSTCCGGDIPKGLVRIKEKGKADEYIMYTASGGIITHLTDCAKIGYLFIDSKGIITTESLNEISKLQGKSFLPSVADHFGLGLDFVNFSLEPYNFGENTLAKGGGTTSFGSFLLVSKKHNLAAAISFTIDNRINPYMILCELCAILLDEYGINIRKEAKKEIPEIDKKPLPAGFSKKFSGMYYKNMFGYRASFDDDTLKFQSREKNGWRDIITDAFFDGQSFISGKRAFTFEEYESNCYLIEENTPYWKRDLWGQKCASFPPINTAWKNRIGKKYIVCDAHPADYMLTSGGFAVAINEYENEEGLLFFAYKGPFAQHALPVIPSGEYETEMILNAPLMGSRDGFAPFIYNKDNIEYLYAFGYNLIDSQYLKPLQSGRIMSPKGRENKAFRTTAGSKIKTDASNDVRIIIFDTELNQQYDSVSGKEIDVTYDGYILFVNEKPMDIWVEVCLF